MSGLDERPVKKKEKSAGSNLEYANIRIQELITALQAVNHGNEYHGFSLKGIIAEFVVGSSCLISGIMALLTTLEPASVFFIVMGVLMLYWGIKDRAEYIEWEERRALRNVEIPYPYMRRISAQEYEKWMLEQNERDRRNAEEY